MKRKSRSVVIHRMEKAVSGGELDDRGRVSFLAKEYLDAENAVKSGSMSQDDFDAVNEWVVSSPSIYVKAMRLVVENGFKVDQVVDNFVHVSTMYALAGFEIGAWAKEALQEKFSGDVKKMKALSRMTNAAELARRHMPYPFPNGKFKLIEEMSSKEAHDVASNIERSVNPEVMCRMDGKARKEALKVVLTKFEFEQRDGQRVGVYRGTIVKDRREVVIDAHNVDTIRRSAGFTA